MAKAALVDALVTDALALLRDLEPTTTDPEATAALGLLALVAGRDVEQDQDGTWKIAQRVVPDRVVSTVDTEARHMRKSRSEYRDGYKTHIAVEPETGLITAAALTTANMSDAKTAPALIGGEAPKITSTGAEPAVYPNGHGDEAAHEAGHLAVSSQGRGEPRGHRLHVGP